MGKIIKTLLFTIGGLLVKLCLDSQNFSSKPKNAGVISQRLTSCQTDITIQELAQYVVQPYGRTWCPAHFGVDENGKHQRQNEYWLGQTIFALDFDGGISWHEVLERCQKNRIHPAFAYTTFSSVDAGVCQDSCRMNLKI